MSFNMSNRRLSNIIKEELMMYLLEKAQEEYDEVAYTQAVQDAKDRGDEEFEFPPGSGEIHTTNELEEGETFSSFSSTQGGVVSTGGVTRSCGPNLSCSPGL